MDIKENVLKILHRHPWEISRAVSIISVAGGANSETGFADIGAGDLYFAGRLKAATGITAEAVDTGYSHFTPNNEFGLKLLTGVSQLNGRSVSTAFLLDVLEHTDNDTALLKETGRILPAGGRLIVTVPAFGFLFSAHDSFLEHRRRYSLKGLTNAASDAGFEIKEIFFFYFSLFLLRFFEVLIFPKKAPLSSKAVSSWGLAEKHPATAFLVFLLNADFRFCRALARLKIFLPGLSLCAVMKKI